MTIKEARKRLEQAALDAHDADPDSFHVEFLNEALLNAAHDLATLIKRRRTARRSA